MFQHPPRVRRFAGIHDDDDIVAAPAGVVVRDDHRAFPRGREMPALALRDAPDKFSHSLALARDMHSGPVGADDQFVTLHIALLDRRAPLARAKSTECRAHQETGKKTFANRRVTTRRSRAVSFCRPAALGRQGTDSRTSSHRDAAPTSTGYYRSPCQNYINSGGRR